MNTCCKTWIALHLTGFLLAASAADKPNVLLIMADDLGYSDLGCYGGEIETPNLDRLADGGLRFTQFYNTGRCWPTRAALLTGYYPHQVRRDTVPGVQSGGRGKRPAWAPLLPERLKTLGYRSYHAGKWHLDSMPLQTGFERSYYLHDQGRFFYPQVHWKDDKKLPPVKPGSGYYATTAIADAAIEHLQKHARQTPDKPFFHYLAFTAPHFPLHALEEDIARYGQRYRVGWEKIRAARWEKMQKLGLQSGELSPPEPKIGPPYHFPEALKILGPGEINRPLRWDELTERQREFQAKKMAIHAAMIDRIDREIGRVLNQLEAMKAMENTLILFLSDNGASAEIMVRSDGHDPKAAAGSGASYLCLGPGWSTVSNTPFRRHKTWVHEGGTATPLIAHWPQGIAARGELRKTPGHVIDVAPTLWELAGGGAIKRQERQPPAPGKSLTAAFARNQTIERDSLWWLHEGNRAIRQGGWKLVAAKNQPWELYRFPQDRAELHDLAKQHPEKVKQLQQLWSKQTEAFYRAARQK